MRTALLSGFVFAVFSAAAAFAFSPDELNKITFDNATGSTIEMIFLSPGDSKVWGPDVVGADYVLKHGASITYYMHYPGASFTFDILAVDDKGSTFDVRGLEIVDGTEARVTLTPTSPRKKASDPAVATVRIDNKTGHEIQYLFFSPSDSHAWGADILDEETIMTDGGSFNILLLMGSEKMKYSLLAVDENSGEYQFNVSIEPRARKELSIAIEPGDLKKAK